MQIMGHPVRKRIIINKFGHPQPSMCHSACCLVLVQACLRAPHVVADEAKLAIVFTYFLGNFFFFYKNKMTFARLLRSLDQPLVPGVYLVILIKLIVLQLKISDICIIDLKNKNLRFQILL